MEQPAMNDDVLAFMKPSLFRRAIAVGALLFCGGFLIWYGAGSATSGLVWKLFMIACGAVLLVLGERLRRATGCWIEFTPEGLRENTGRVLCALDDIEKVERGAFAFKPSNGLLVRLKNPAEPVWATGLWWRFGRKIGIGGVTSPSQSKFMADMIAMHQVLRDADVIPPKQD